MLAAIVWALLYHSRCKKQKWAGCMPGQTTAEHGMMRNGFCSVPWRRLEYILLRTFNSGFGGMNSSSPFRIAVLISGGGTTLHNFIEKIAAGRLPAEIALVVSSSPTARGLQFAADAGIPSVVIERKAFASQDDFSRAIFDNCRRSRIDLAVLAGFLKRLTIPADFSGRVVNIHPALVPAFCGEGFYGHKVHEAVLEYGAKLSGCTVHFADNQYDHGPVILQRAVPVLDDDTPETLAARVFEAECEAYPEALRLIADGRVSLEGRRVRIGGEP
jgi:phosphoribosylglycinamide formyltransferase 1